MKYALGIMVGVALLLMACTTTIEVVSPKSTPALGDISALEQYWIDMWVDDGDGSVTEARCLWRYSVNHFGSEAALMAALTDIGGAAVNRAVIADDPAVYGCFEFD